jgi:hypothetical protein
MITFLTTARHRYTIDGFRRIWGASLSHVIRILSYERLFGERSVQGGVFVFTDLDRLSRDDRQKAAQWYRTLKQSGATVLTDPERFVGRLPLLKQLHRTGINRFNAANLDERHKLELPAFLRYDEGHDGPRSGLIFDRETLEAEIGKPRSGGRGRRLIVVEFLDYKEADGLYYKYTHFRVGRHLIFGGMVCGAAWCLKEARETGAAVLERERQAASNRDHDEELMRCFDAAGIEFGRIDYAIVDGRVQVFEVNSNPDMGIPCPPSLDRWKTRSRCYQAINEALWELHAAAGHRGQVATPGAFSPRYLGRRIKAWGLLRGRSIRKALNR